MGACNGARCCGNDIKDAEYDLRSSGAEPPLVFAGRTANNEALVRHIASVGRLRHDESDSENYADRLALLDIARLYASVLTLKVISSHTIPLGETLTITAQGLRGGRRNARDGYTYFGCKKRGRTYSREEKGEILNDYVIKARDKDLADRHRGRHFEISYCPKNSTYRIRDLGAGFGAFVKIEGQMALMDGQLLSMGESFFIVNLVQDEGKKETPVAGRDRLRIKAFTGTATVEVFYFNKCKKHVQIGRTSSCEIRLEDTMLSKHQASLVYDEERGWMLEDGTKGKPSTNGTWLYLSDYWEIKSGTVVRACQSVFELNVK